MAGVKGDLIRTKMLQFPKATLVDALQHGDAPVDTTSVRPLPATCCMLSLDNADADLPAHTLWEAAEDEGFSSGEGTNMAMGAVGDATMLGDSNEAVLMRRCSVAHAKQ